MVVNFSLVLWLAVVVCLAWAVGAYSRLNRMREQAARARASLLKYCKLYLMHAEPLSVRAGIAFGEREHVAPATRNAGAVPLRNLVTAVWALQAPLAAWEGQASSNQGPAKAFGTALDAVQSCVEALVSAPDDLAGALWPTEERNRWLDLATDVRVRRSRYNAYASELNEATLQMPAAFLARLLGIQVWEQV